MSVLLVTGKWLFGFLASDWPCDALPLSSPFSAPLPSFCLFLSLSLTHLLALQLPYSSLIPYPSPTLFLSPTYLPPSFPKDAQRNRGSTVSLLINKYTGCKENVAHQNWHTTRQH